MNFRRLSLLLIVISLLLSGCIDTGLQTGIDQSTNQPEEQTADWYSLYFSQPGSPQAEQQRGGPDEALAQAIDQAHISVEASLYDLNLWSIRDALLDARRRGLQVRVVTESDHLDREEIQDLITAGIPVLGDRREGLMHDKFLIIDRYEVWTGSMNLTLNGAYHNDNNLLRIRSTRLADDYLTEFEEMFTHDLFGDASVADTPYPQLSINGTPLQVYFSPDDGAAAHLVDTLQSAEESIYFLTFSLTSDPISQALLDAHRRGLDVAGVIEKGQSDNAGSDYQGLLDAGIDVRLDTNPANMHHKVMIIDGQVVITGSYNFSRSAEERNDENVLVIENKGLAAAYMQEFDRIYNNGR